MKRLFLCAAVLAGVSAAGCRSAGRQELLERDLRFQEDRINHMQGHLADYRQQLDCAQAENDALRDEVVRLKGVAAPLGPPPAARPVAPFRTPQIVPPDAQVPDVQLPRGQLQDVPPSGGRPRLQRAPDGSPAEIPLGPPKVELPGASSSDARQPPLEQQAMLPIAQLTVNRQLTGGYDSDQQSGDDGVMVCLEPRSANGEIVELHGPVSIVVMDPALQGPASRVARWDLAADDVAARFRRSPQGAGVQLELPWPNTPPVHRQLKLFVRHSTADGRKLDVDQDIEVIRPGEHVRRWTRSARQARVRTVPIANPAPERRELAESAPPADSPVASPVDEPELAVPAVAGRPQWTPYR